MMKERHKIRNDLTEHKGNYKLINPCLVDCYASLSPPMLSKISLVIFSGILSNKRYFKNDAPGYSECEEKRIYNSTTITPEFILRQCTPSKYVSGNYSIRKDIGNLVKRLQDLDKKNIFYLWTCGFPHVYMFFIERDIGVWQPLNPNACVIPRTILKLVRNTRWIVDAMQHMLRCDKQIKEREDIEMLWMVFLENMVKRCHPDIAKMIVNKPGLTLYNYVEVIETALAEVDPYYGLVEDASFMKNLPKTVHDKLSDKRNKQGQKTMNMTSDVAEHVEIAPLTKRVHNDAPVRGEIEAEIGTFEGIDPFKNCNTFIRFYRDSILFRNSCARFVSTSSERTMATEILDLLIVNHRDNVRFLKGWINFFMADRLRGNSAFNHEKTTLRAFRDTFSEFNIRYMEPV